MKEGPGKYLNKKMKGRKPTVKKKKYFGNVEYVENGKGNVIEIKASNGTFKISKNSFIR